MASLLLKGGRVVDGTGKAAFEADVLVRDGKIAAVGRGLSGADRVIDVTGLTVAPGFIDTHSHSDLDVLLRPQVLPKIMQGITTELLGQDGVSLAPLPTRFISPWRKNLAGLDGDSDEIDWTFETTDNYLKMIEAAHPGLNEMYLVRTATSAWRPWGWTTACPRRTSWRPCAASPAGRWRRARWAFPRG